MRQLLRNFPPALGVAKMRLPIVGGIYVAIAAAIPPSAMTV